MSYTVEKLPNEPILLHVLNTDYSIGAEAEQALMDMFKVLDAQQEPIYLILDISEVSLSLEDAIQGTSLATRQHKLFKHPNVFESVLVTDSRLMKLIAQGLNNPIFGNIILKTFDSRSAALAYVRSQNVQKTP